MYSTLQLIALYFGVPFVVYSLVALIKSQAKIKIHGIVPLLISFAFFYVIHNEFIYLKIRNSDSPVTLVLSSRADTVFTQPRIPRGGLLIDLRANTAFLEDSVGNEKTVSTEGLIATIIYHKSNGDNTVVIHN